MAIDSAVSSSLISMYFRIQATTKTTPCLSDNIAAMQQNATARRLVSPRICTDFSRSCRLASHGYQTTTFAHSTIVSDTCFGDNALNSERSEKRLIGTSTRRAKGHHRRDRKHPAVIAPNDLPVALVHHPVMPGAEKGEVGRLIVPALDPGLPMVSPGPARPP